MDLRYMVACARLASLADTSRWTVEELADVAALVNPVIPFDVWAGRVQRASSTAENPPPLAQDSARPFPPGNVEDPITTGTMNAILGGQAQSLIDLGILKVEESA